MEVLEHVLVFAHFVGFASLLGGMIVQLREPAKQVNAAMRDGIGLAFVAGLLIVGVLEGMNEDLNHAKIGVKFAIALVILVLVMVNMRKQRIPDGLFYGLLVLTLTNIGIAIFW